LYDESWGRGKGESAKNVLIAFIFAFKVKEPIKKLDSQHEPQQLEAFEILCTM
jgi:hypothetical protein